MLKIKDSVQLTELEKFGFKYSKNYGYYYVGDECCGSSIYIDESRHIDFDDEWWGDDFDLIETLYELIKADLVEKVENE